MRFSSFFKQWVGVRFTASFLFGTARVAALPLIGLCLSDHALADSPPLGYVGPAPSVLARDASIPPLGYTGPAPFAFDHTVPPVGYIGPVVAAKAVAADMLVDRTAPAPHFAPPLYNHTGETLITAQQMHSDSTTGITTATGKVELVRSDYVLHADKVTYNQKTGIMTADGHVALLTPTGEVEFADHEEITGDMKQAFAEQVGILFPDNSRMAARTSQRYDERYTVANGGIYTACNVCQQNPDNPPIWQLRADSITHDNVAHEIYYHDATLDFAGVPVAYTPYLSSPDPTVKRAQGFLSPQPGYNANIGAYVKTPYYFDIAPDKDAVLTPTFSTIDKLQMAGEYRERFVNGNLDFNGSITHADLVDAAGVDKGQQWRGDLFGKFLYDIDSTWRAGTDVQYVSDQSYLQRYQLSSLDQAVSHAYVEGLHARDYAALDSYYFQDLRPGVSVAEPVVLPSATVNLLGDPGQAWGGRWSFDGNTLTTVRSNNQGDPQQGFDTRRLSMSGGWQRQLISSTGLETTISGLLRTDSYWANNVAASSNANAVYGQALFTREFEQANAVMRYPMGRSGDGYQQLMEPIVAFTAAPNVRLVDKQPIEDSLDVEFDETNLFSPNRFTGSDLIEGGSRVTYGMRNAITSDSGARIDVFGGESYDLTTNDQFPTQSGLNGHASDYVGRIDFAPANWINANYGFRLAQSDLSPQRQDAYVSVGAPIARPSVRYIEAYQTDPTTGLIDLVRQATFGFSSQFTKYWGFNLTHTQGFDPQPGPRNSSLNLNYVDECLAYGMTVSKDDTNRLDISSGTSVTFHVFLKSLGGFGTDSASGVQFPATFRQTE